MDLFDATKRYTVAGLGTSGRSVVRFLRSKQSSVLAVDQTERLGQADALSAEFPGLR